MDKIKKSSFKMSNDNRSLRSDKINSITKGTTDVNKEIDCSQKLAVIEDKCPELNKNKPIPGKTINNNVMKKEPYGKYY